MADHSDDEDAYLYGSDDEAPGKTEDVVETKSKSPSVAKESADEDDESVDEDSDDDIDIIIGDDSTAIKPTVVTENDAGETGTNDDKATTTIVAKDLSDSTTTIDVNSVAEYEGKPLTQIDLSTFKDKPWRAPGADISDYFNYGFDEFAWTAYTAKQDKLRGEFNPQKLFAELMKSGAGAPPPQAGPNGMPMMMPPGMPMMPGMPMGMMPPGMPPGMPPMPNMPNMPPMPMPNMPGKQLFNPKQNSSRK